MRRGSAAARACAACRAVGANPSQPQKTAFEGARGQVDVQYESQAPRRRHPPTGEREELPSPRLTTCRADRLGAQVAPLLVIEAMKMEHEIVAPAAGTVAGLHVEQGAQVDAGAVPAVIEEDGEATR